MKRFIRRKVGHTTQFRLIKPHQWPCNHPATKARGNILQFCEFQTGSRFKDWYTRDSQKVRGHFQLLSHLLNVFKSYLVFRKKCFHSLINANIKQITAVVPKIIDLKYTWDSRSGTRQTWELTSSNFIKKLARNTMYFYQNGQPNKIKNITYAFNKPSLTYIKWHFVGQCFIHLHSAVKMK